MKLETIPRASSARGCGFAAVSIISVCLTSCQAPSNPAAIYRECIALREKGDPERELKRLEVGIRISSAQSSDLFYSFLIEKATILARKGLADQALEVLAPEPPHRSELAQVRVDRKLQQGWANFLQARYENTKKLYEEAHSIAEEAKLEGGLARVEFAQGTLLVRMGSPAEAEARIRSAYARAQALGNKALVVRGLETLADVLARRARYEDAIFAIDQELRNLGATDDPSIRSRALTNQGWCYSRLGELDRAILLYQRAAELDHATGNRYAEQVDLGDLGDAYLSKGDFAKAKSANERALAIASEIKAIDSQSRWLTNLARVSIADGEYKQAAGFNTKAIELKEETKDLLGIQYAMVDTARILAGEGRSREAVEKLRKIAEETSDDVVPALEAHQYLAEIYTKSGDNNRALGEYRAALRVAHNARQGVHADENKMNLFASMMEIHHKFVDFLMSLGKVEQAMEIAAESKAHLLQERVGERHEDPHPTSAQYRAIARATGATLVSYWLGAKRSFAWVISPDRVTWEELPPRQTIDSLVERYRGTIQNLYDPLEGEELSGRELANAVWSAVSKRITPGTPVIVAPDGGLTAINFEALPVLSPKPHYLIEDLTISVVPSLSLLTPGRASTSPAKLLLIGDPNFATEQFPKLPFAGDEIRAVKRHFGRNVTSYEHAAAAPAAYLNAPPKDFRFIHFTAHATANRESPMDSAIILDGPNGANRLSVRDVLKQPLQAELVVISACRSAGAKTYAGEGLVGFMWAFFQAGARNIIAGLWDVSDESTPQLMDDLYEALQSGQGPAEALRAAKLKMMRSNQTFGLPYYWAPFQLYVREAGRSAAPKHVPMQ